MYNFPDKDHYNNVAGLVCRCVSWWAENNIDAEWEDPDDWFCREYDGIRFDSVDQLINCCGNLIAEIKSPNGIFQTRDENFIWDAIINEAFEYYCVPLWDDINDKDFPHQLDYIVESVLPICMAHENPERWAEIYFEDQQLATSIEFITWDSDYEIFCASEQMWKDALAVVRPLAASESLVLGEHFSDVYFSELAQRTRAKIAKLAAKYAEPEVEQKPQECVTVRARAKAGLVYLIQSGDSYKIGHTTQDDPSSRLSYYQTAHPGPLLMPLVIKSDDSKQTETNLHRQFSSKRIRGEWFTLNEADIQQIKKQFNGSVQTFDSIDCVLDAAIQKLRS